MVLGDLLGCMVKALLFSELRVFIFFFGVCLCYTHKTPLAPALIFSTLSNSPHNKGFTLVEVMVATALFALVAVGIASTTIMTSRIAYGNIYENTAYMVAQAYAEQIKSISFNEIREALEDPVGHDIPTQSLSYEAGVSANLLKQEDPLIFGVPTQKDIVVDVETNEAGGTEVRTMRMTFTPMGQSLRDVTSCWESIEIVLNFEWEVVDGNSQINKEGAVRLVKTNVSE